MYWNTFFEGILKISPYFGRFWIDAHHTKMFYLLAHSETEIFIMVDSHAADNNLEVWY